MGLFEVVWRVGSDKDDCFFFVCLLVSEFFEGGGVDGSFFTGFGGVDELDGFEVVKGKFDGGSAGIVFIGKFLHTTKCGVRVSAELLNELFSDLLPSVSKHSQSTSVYRKARQLPRKISAMPRNGRWP